MEEDTYSDIDRRAQDRVGTTVGGRWRLQSLLGVGGMAAVYAAERLAGEGPKRAAIKMLHPELSADKLIRKRFVREGYVANAIEHPGAVKIFGNALAEDGSLYLEMELLEGMTLDERCQRAGALPMDEVLDLVDQLLATLVVAHESNVLHRDLKPENLFLTQDGELKILDFGIARMRQGDGRGTTQTGDVIGTPLFMAPEQARGRWEQVDQRSDLWAVGAVAFTLLSGRPVHIAKTTTDALVKVVTEPVCSLAAVQPDLPAAVVAWVDRALAFEQEARFPQAADMRRALHQVCQQVLGRLPASRITYGETHPLSTRRPSAITPDDPTRLEGRPPRARPGAYAGATLPSGDSSSGSRFEQTVDAATFETPPPASLTIPTKRSPWIWVAAVALLLLVVGGVAFNGRGTEGAAPAPSTSGALPVAAPQPESSPPPVEPQPADRPAPSASAEVVHEPSPSSTVPSNPSPATKPTYRQPPVPPPPAASENDDPFAKRH